MRLWEGDWGTEAQEMGPACDRANRGGIRSRTKEKEEKEVLRQQWVVRKRKQAAHDRIRSERG